MKCHACDAEYKTTDKPYGLLHYKCPQCGHRYRTAENPAKYHAVDYTQRLNTKEPEQRVHNELIKMIQPFVSQCKTILDVGPGLGLFAKRASKWAKVEAVEVNPTFAKANRDLGLTVYVSDFMVFETDRVWDAVTIWSTLEHFDDINLLMEKMKAMSSRFVMFEIPTEDFSDYYIKRFFKPEYRGHLHNFTLKSIDAYVKKHNLKVLLNRKGSRQQCQLLVCEKN